MKRALTLCAAVLCLTMTLAPTAMAAGTDEVEVCYPTAITQSEDGTELRKLYDLGRRMTLWASPGLILSRTDSTTP